MAAPPELITPAVVKVMAEMRRVVEGQVSTTVAFLIGAFCSGSSTGWGRWARLDAAQNCCNQPTCPGNPKWSTSGGRRTQGGRPANGNGR